MERAVVLVDQRLPGKDFLDSQELLVFGWLSVETTLEVCEELASQISDPSSEMSKASAAPRKCRADRCRFLVLCAVDRRLAVLGGNDDQRRAIQILLRSSSTIRPSDWST